MKKKGQIWTVDFITGFVLFIIIIFVALKLIINLVPNNQYENIYREGSGLSTTLLKPGYPNSWNETTVILPGIAENNRINLTKLSRYDNMSYGRLKTLFHLSNEYIFLFRNATSVINISKCVRGFDIAVNTTTCEPDFSTIKYENLVRFDRIVIINSTLSNMVIYLWN